MTKYDTIANKIYEALNAKGADLGNCSIGIITKILETNEEDFLPTTKEGFTRDQKENLLINALESGYSGWVCVDEDTVSKRTQEDKDNGVSFAERVFRTVEEGGSVAIYDSENPDDLLGVINKEKMDEAEVLMKENHTQYYADVLTEGDDAETADVWLQLVVMGEVTFG